MRIFTRTRYAIGLHISLRRAFPTWRYCLLRLVWHGRGNRRGGSRHPIAPFGPGGSERCTGFRRYLRHLSPIRLQTGYRQGGGLRTWVAGIANVACICLGHTGDQTPFFPNKHPRFQHVGRLRRLLFTKRYTLFPDVQIRRLLMRRFALRSYRLRAESRGRFRLRGRTTRPNIASASPLRRPYVLHTSASALKARVGPIFRLSGRLYIPPSAFTHIP